MNKEQFNIGQSDPELPEIVKDAKQNHGGMIVPDDFFVSFEKKMNAIIDAEVLTHQPVLSTREEAPSIRNRWIGVAAAAMAIAVIGAAFHFDWFSTQIPEQQGLIATVDETDVLDPSEDVYYTSLSDYEVYDLICGL